MAAILDFTNNAMSNAIISDHTTRSGIPKNQNQEAAPILSKMVSI